MCQQGGAIGPLLEKHQPQRVFAIDMDGVRDAAGLAARAMDVLEAELSDFVETILTCRYAAGHYNHAILPSVGDAR